MDDRIIKRIWGEDTYKYKVFLSHISKYKDQTTKIKNELANFGISCFVAHEDINPCTEWADEIDNALFSADACVALITDAYHESDWTDHEIGCSYGRKIPVIPVKLEHKVPYGIIGKIQAVSCTWNDAPMEILEQLLKRPEATNAYIQAMRSCWSFAEANRLAEAFPYIESMTDDQIDSIIAAWASNDQLRGSHGFAGNYNYKRSYGPGLAYYMAIWNPTRFPSENDARTALSNAIKS